MVFSGLVTAWRLAGWPTRRSPSSVKATIEGVVRMPSAFSITFGVLPSMTATHELVVPRSMPMTLPMVLPLKLRQAGRAAWRPNGNVSGSSADPRSSPLDTRFAAFLRLNGSYRRARGGRKSVSHEIASFQARSLVNGYRTIAAARKPGYAGPSVWNLWESARHVPSPVCIRFCGLGLVSQHHSHRTSRDDLPPGSADWPRAARGHEAEHAPSGVRRHRTECRNCHSRSSGQRVPRP